MPHMPRRDAVLKMIADGTIVRPGMFTAPERKTSPPTKPVAPATPGRMLYQRPRHRPRDPIGEVFAYGVTTVPARLAGVLPRTIDSLAEAGFTKPRLFVDGARDAQPWAKFGLKITTHYPQVRTFGNWVMGLWELYLRNPNAELYAIFQDDIVCCRNLRRYLQYIDIPEDGYVNLYTHHANQKLSKGKHGVFLANQRGLGALGLVFSRKAVAVLLASSYMVHRPQRTEERHLGWKSVDGAIVTALSKAGFREYCHDPSLVQHTGDESVMGNRRSSPARAPNFLGERSDAMSLCRRPVPVTRKPRVAVLTPVLGWGGTERWTYEFIRAVQDEYDVTVGVVNDQRLANPGAVEALRELAPVVVQHSRQFPAWLRDFDLIKAWGVLNLARMVRKTTAPIIGCCHGEDVGWTKRWVDDASSCVTHWVAVSKAALSPLASVHDSRRTVIYNAIDAARCLPTRPREQIRTALGFGAGDFVIGYLGRLSSEKRVPVIADAVGVLGGNFRGLVVGDGNQRGKINRHGGRVVVAPHTFAIGDMLAAMDCIVGICDHEGFWRVGLETAIAGVPLVSTRAGILREIAEQHGVLWEEVPAGVDAAGVASAVQRLREAGGKPGRTERMRQVAGAYSLERFGTAWKALMGRLVHSARHP